MPRDGSGAADNMTEDDPGHNIVHGDGAATADVDRSDKAVPPPEPEKGEAIEGMNASGAGDSAASGNTGSGKGGEQ